MYDDVICFIDGTRRHVCRPCQRPEDTARGLSTQQKSYNGHKRRHVFGVQSVVAPNGMIVALGRPFRGRRHDSYALSQSRLNAKLACLSRETGITCKGYGDAAYPVLSHVLKASGSEDQRRVMNRVRTSVEWGFNKVLEKWAGVNFYAKEKIYLNRPAKKYIVAVLLTNMHTCCEGSQTSLFFKCRPPSLESYMSTPARVRD
jgi:nuclease HARBI1